MDVDGEIAFIDYTYKKSSNTIYLIHTEVPKTIQEKGVAAKIVLSALMDIKVKEMILVPICPYIVTYIKRHREWIDIVHEGKKKDF